MPYEAKTRPTEADVAAFLDRVEPAVRREDGRVVCELMRKVSGEDPQMWGPSIIGFGRHAYRYASGHTGETSRIGFSPRKGALVFYLSCNAAQQESLLARLGKHTTGVGCLYIKKLAEVDMAILEELIRAAWAHPEPA
ncbi:DUF1801 domain-containing protein [Phenylobacterium sp.]|jgi:hypothetical protein|uniref:DUF1801 domain-containing protein n=1 Tax=Phenylobacterium sp. TaxID=1871053 RepID=UPI002E35A952|nr:DUF1801 domain-containing protein [Phenylobacterium sp.]HEX2560438.1 DUF1801 domain-containing protein [Phenylobacterium sp.]